MIVSVGEILADIVMNGEKGEMRAMVGGAPFNVAVNALQSGGNVLFYGQVGRDPIGTFIKEQVKRKLPSDRFLIQTDNVRPTTLAIVSIGETGERDFRFIRENSADYHMDSDAIRLEKGGEKASIVHIGSLMLSEETGRVFAEKIAEKAKKEGAKISFDVNYREDIFHNGQDAFACYEPLIQKADIVKFSEEEIEKYLKKPAEDGILYLSNPIVCVTLGKKGCLVKTGEKVLFVPSEPVVPVDTTGAGDAFFGTFLAGIDGLHKDLKELTEEEILFITRAANQKGGETTLFKGAVKI